jgi:hypothetical protein
MRETRIQIAKADIFKLFEKSEQKVFKYSDLSEILREQRGFWRLAQGMSTHSFVEFLIDEEKLSAVTFPFPKPYSQEVRFVWRSVDLPEVLLTLKPHCHFSHYSAVYFHGLTEQIPKTFYLNFEQPLGSNSTGELAQKGIDAAFKRPVRTTKYVAETKDFRVYLLNGKNTGYLGVEDNPARGAVLRDAPTTTPAFGFANRKFRVTNIERTLIDIAVRPIYSGGVDEVLKAYGRARDVVSVNRLAAMLQKLGYIYPYHQVVGFYLERAGYKANLLELLRRFPMEFDFYLAHNIKNTEYVKDWRLYVPKGF